MKLKHITVGALLGISLVGLGFWYGHVSASTNDPGSATDPLVSKSYVDGRSTFQVVTLKKDQMIVGESGTEMVMRAGKTTAVVSPMGGILDATTGVDLKQNESIGQNHLLVIPVSDGRGLNAQTDAILIVKGPYTIKPSAQ